MTSQDITLERQFRRSSPDVPTGLLTLITDIASCCKRIAAQVNRVGLGDLLGSTGQENVQGEEVQKLDRFADDLLIRRLVDGERCCILGSEEREFAIPVAGAQGDFAVLFDPLDGSSNIDVNVSIGTIFAIYLRKSDAPGEGTLEDLLQPGSALVAAGYAVYGSSTMFVYSAGDGVHGFTLDPRSGKYLLSNEHLVMPERAIIYSVNEGYTQLWDPAYRELIDSYKQSNDRRKAMSLRYIGSLVADFHRNLLLGGVFHYPAVLTDGVPEAKLRLLYEAAPLAFLAEQAGGAASDGRRSILEIQPTELHQRVPLIVGCRADVEEAVEFLHGGKSSG